MLKYLSSCLVVQGSTKTSLSPIPSLSSAYWILFLSPFSKVLSPFFQVSIPLTGKGLGRPYLMQPLRSLGRRRRPEISSPLLLSFRASKTSLLVRFYSVYRLLCYLPSLNSFHEILFCGIRMANSGLLKTSSCLVVSGKLYKNLTFFSPSQ